MSSNAHLVMIPLLAIIGYLAGTNLPGAFRKADPPAAPAAQIDQRSAESLLRIDPYSELIAEWEKLRADHGSTTAEMPLLYAAVKEIKDPFRRRAFRAALVADWAAIDPLGALTYLQEKDRGVAEQLMREWLRIDPQAA